MMKEEWEFVTGSGDALTYRLRVPGGWLYKVMEYWDDVQEFNIALAFVPEPLHFLRKQEGSEP